MTVTNLEPPKSNLCSTMVRLRSSPVTSCISIWMKLGSIRTLYECQSPRSRGQYENQQRPYCNWVVGKQYRPPWNIRSSPQQSMNISFPSPATQLTTRRKTSYCREHWQREQTKLRQLCKVRFQLCDVSEPWGSVNHVHREDTMCRQEVGEHESPM